MEDSVWCSRANRVAEIDWVMVRIGGAFIGFYTVFLGVYLYKQPTAVSNHNDTIGEGKAAENAHSISVIPYGVHPFVLLLALIVILLIWWSAIKLRNATTKSETDPHEARKIAILYQLVTLISFLVSQMGWFLVTSWADYNFLTALYVLFLGSTMIWRVIALYIVYRFIREL